jgi:uncharacterized C2H2 Zn-finger protein
MLAQCLCIVAGIGCPESFDRDKLVHQYDPQARSNQCPHCGKVISQARNLSRHVNTCSLNANPRKVIHLCQLCDATFSRSDSLRGHMRKVHLIGEKLVCPKCRAPLPNEASMERHVELCYMLNL